LLRAPLSLSEDIAKIESLGLNREKLAKQVADAFLRQIINKCVYIRIYTVEREREREMRMYMCIYIYIYIHIMYVYLCMYVYIYIYIYVCIH